MVSTKTDIILLCGGKGSRLATVTNDIIPKSLVSVNGKSLMSYTLDLLTPKLIGRLIFAVDHYSFDIKEWVSRQALENEVVFSESGPGILSAVQAALNYSNSPNIIICNTDEIRQGLQLESVLHFHVSQNNIATMPATLSTNLDRYRLLELGNNSVIIHTKLKSSKFAENADIKGLVNIGFIVIRKNSQKYFDDNFGKSWGAIIDPLVQKRLCKALPLDIVYFNVGTVGEFNEAEEYFKKKHLERTRG